jgi:putative SOS response-associated peptidase YedK
MKDSSPFGFAGLWEVWSDGSEKVATCCIITTDANSLVGSIHNRMPAIIPRSDYSAWLSNDTPAEELRAMLKPYPAEEMEAVEVGSAVNSPKTDSPLCIAPA